MNFKYIKTLSNAPYSIHVNWCQLKSWLDKQSEYLKLNLDPPYQRGYVWNDYQKSKYIEYILKGGISGKEIYWNCKSWNTSIERNDILELVDGKQRLNTVLEFLDNKVSIFDGHYFKDIDGHMRDIHARFLFSINDLQNQLDVVDWYIGLNEGGSAHSVDDIAIAYNYKKSLLNKS